MAEDLDNEEYEDNLSSDMLSARAKKDNSPPAHIIPPHFEKEMIKGGFRKEFGAAGTGWMPSPNNRIEEIKKVPELAKIPEL